MMPMNRILLFLLPVLCSLTVATGQSINEHPLKQTEPPFFPAPQRIPQLSEERFSAEKYAEQERAWLNMLRRDSTKPGYWLNAYRAVRFGDAVKTASPVKVPRQQLLDSLVKAMPENCKNSFEYFYLGYLNGRNNPALFTQLEKAYELEPKRPELAREFIFHYAVTGETESQKPWLQRWEKQFRNDSSLQIYAHNMLSGLEPNAVLIAGSETDAFPLLAEQRLRNYRTDVLVVCLAAFHNDAMLQDFFVRNGLNEPEHSFENNGQRDFLREIFKWNPQRPFYLAASVEKELLTGLQKNLFITGLAFRYSDPGFDNLPVLYKNITAQYTWRPGSASGIYWIPQLEMNYVLPLLLTAAEERKKGNTTQAVAWENKALAIAERAGRKNDVKKYLARGG